ncbi:MAG TPA: hypothetical protein VJ827_05570 [Rubrobacter sp.]|nr:hypothetical protein [Rubrobacter sp.]
MDHRKIVARLAWSLCLLCVGLVLCAPLLWALNGRSLVGFIREGDGAIVVLVISFSVVGALIVSHRPENTIGWIFCAAALFQALSEVGLEYATYALVTRPGSLPLGAGMSWLAEWIWAPGLGLILVFLPLLFPDGRPPSHRWRPVAWLGGLSIGLICVPVSILIWSDRGKVLLRGGGNGEEMGWLLVLGEIGFPIMLLAGLLAVASLFVRFRRARGDERQQIKWFAFAAAVTLAWILVFEQLLGAEGGALEAVAAVSSLVLVPSIPVATGIAIFRYRLFDIDRIVNRALVYFALTVSLVLVYLGGVISLQYAFRALAFGESQLAVVASTLAIAALFNPLRRRIQAFIDRRFYRRRYDARKTLEVFSVRLRDETDLDSLSGELIAVVRESMQPARVTLWLRPQGEDGESER